MVDLPRPADVALLYDHLARFSVEFTPNLHFGYWPEGVVDNPVETVAIATERLTDLVIEKIRTGSGKRVLDIGCGQGGAAVQLALATKAEVVGITISEEQVALASEYAASLGVQDLVSFRRADAMELPFGDAEFDAAFALESMIHMPDRSVVMREVNRVVRPGGRFVLTDMFERAAIPAAERELVDALLRGFAMAPLPTAEDYPALMRAAGMWLNEFLDITEQTVRNTLISWDQIMGHSLTRQPAFWEANPPFDGTRLAQVEEFGYLLAVARVKPTASC